MNKSFWLSYICPYFSVRDGEQYEKNLPDVPLSMGSLAHVGFFQAATWFYRNKSRWDAFESGIPGYIESCEKKGLRICLWGDPDYPKKLKNLNFPPAVLTYKGPLEILGQGTVAVVGARCPTHLGRQWVQKVIPVLAKLGLTVVSGGARGIDCEAHLAAMQGAGKTVAFLPGGVDKPYPRGNRYVFEKILVEGGMLISEFLPGTEVRGENFHRRNRLIVGSSAAVIIVEAGLKSGTIMTANKAVAENIDVLVVPGHPLVSTYAGSLELLAQGASMVRDELDILNFLTQRNVLKKTPDSPNLVE